MGEKEQFKKQSKKITNIGFKIRFASDGRSQRCNELGEPGGETRVIIHGPVFICVDGSVSAHVIVKNN